MPGGIIYQIAENFNREVKAMTRRASSELVRAYGEIWKKLNAEILRLTKEYQASNSKDAHLWLIERGRLRVLQAQIEVELRKFADRVNQETRAAQEEAIREAQLRAAEGVAALARQAGVDLFWNKIDPRVLTQMVGVLQRGSPLDKILRGYGDEAVESMGNKLLNGLAMGLGPREIARNIRIDMAMDLTRALRISRTEIIRAKRESSRLSYKENPKLIGGYIRRSARQSSTCAACWALDGVIYSLDTPLDDHPNGMCYEVPYIPELDKFYDRSDTGASAFEKLSDDEKREILGPAKFLAWKEGKFGLEDLVVHTHNDKWGDMTSEASLKTLLGEEDALYYLTLAQNQLAKEDLNADELIKLAGLDLRSLSSEEIGKITNFVAERGFNDKLLEKAGGRLTGLEWEGSTVKGSDMMGAGVVHYLRHVVGHSEWPVGTTLDQYYQSITEVIKDPTAGVLVSRYQGVMQLTFIREAGNLAGPDSKGIILVEYRTQLGQLVTANQTSTLEEILRDSRRSDIIWIRKLLTGN